MLPDETYKPEGRVPLDLHEQFVERHLPKDAATHQPIPDGVITPMVVALAHARQEAERIINTEKALLADRTRTRIANLAMLADRTSSITVKAAERIDKAMAAARAKLDEIDNLTAYPDRHPDPMMAGEIRTAMRDPKDRKAIIEDAFARQDLLVLGAVLRAPAFLVGMSQSEMDAVRLRYRQTFHPEDWARRERIAAALDSAERAGRSFVGMGQRILRSPEMVAAVKASEASAAALREAE